MSVGVWTGAIVFGEPPASGAIVRPSAYGVVSDGTERVAVVRTPQGLFLPGGGMDDGESPRQTVIREVAEECGLTVSIGAWNARAIDFVYSFTELTYFEKRSTFVDAHVSGLPVERREPDHELAWMTPSGAIVGLEHPSHRWAVAQWIARGSLT